MNRPWKLRRYEWRYRPINRLGIRVGGWEELEPYLTHRKRDRRAAWLIYGDEEYIEVQIRNPGEEWKAYKP